MARGLRCGEPVAPRLPRNHPDPVREPVRMERGLPQSSSLGQLAQEIDPALKDGTAQGPGPVDVKVPFTLGR
jgi:hypothetical protein